MKSAVRTVLITLVALAALGTLGAAPVGAAPTPPKAIVLSAGPATVGPGQPTRLNLSLTPKDGGRPRGGTVTWRTGDTVLGTATATRRVTALVLDDLPLGTYEIVAEYSGDPITAPATSNTVTVTVAPFRTFTDIASTAASVPAGTRAEIKADVRAARWPVRVTGSVTFTATSSAGTRTGTVPLSNTAKATWRPLLPEGDWEIVAHYNGVEDLYAPSDSAPLALDVSQPATIDQSVTTTPETYLPVGNIRWAQTFTAGRTGELTQVDLTFQAETGGFSIALWSVGQDGNPVAPVLGSESVPTGRGAGVVPALFDPPIPVTAGTTYAIVVQAVRAGTNVRGVQGSNPYAGGRLVGSPSGSGWLDLNGDVTFATWVRSSIV